MTLDPQEIALLAFMAALWLAAALFAWISALRQGNATRAALQRLSVQDAMIDSAPSLPLLVRPGGAIEGSERLADWLGMGALPPLFSDLSGTDAGLGADAFEVLSSKVTRASKGGGDFTLFLRPAGGARELSVTGARAPLPLPVGSVLLWFSDVSGAEAERGKIARARDDAEEALRALGQLIEAAPFPMWFRDPALKLALVNSAYVDAVEAGSQAIVIERSVELLEAGREGDGRAGAERARQIGKPVSRTMPVTISGQRRMVRIVDVPVGPGGVAGYAIDIHEQEQARAELGRFEDAQRDMLDRLSAGVAQFAPDRSLVFSNRPFARQFDLEPELLADRPEFDRVLEGMREGGQLPDVRDFPEWKAERRGWFQNLAEPIEEPWLLPGGVHIRVVAQPLPDGGLLLIFEDRTVEVQLASARDTLLRVRAATLENLFEAIGVFAADGRLYLWNGRFREAWGFDEASLAEHPRVDELLPAFAKKLADPEHAGLVRELVRSATGERQQRLGRVLFADGRHYEFAAVPLPDGNALFTMLDVTDSRRMEGALRERAEALEAADRVKTAFVANMSYELRTPLTSIGGFAEMLAGGYVGPLEPSARDYVAAILEAVARLGKLIDDVLALTQDDAMPREPVPVADICADCAGRFADQAAATGIEFVSELDASAASVRGDRRRLTEALDHLVRNALQHTAPGGRVLLHAEGDEAEARIVVSDNGTGIASEEQALVFDRFHRSGEVSGAALGLGLPLVRQFIEGHGGRVALVSEPGQGTSVTIHLPR